MDLSLTDKILTFIKMPFQSFLMIEIFIIFIILYIFLVYNEKRNNRKVRIILSGLFIFFFSLLTFYFYEDMVSVISEIIKTLMRCFYFPNIIFYILTAVISLIILLYTILKNKTTKLNKIITYTFSTIHLYLFTTYIALAISKNMSLINTSDIYKHNDMFILVLASQTIFILFVIYKIIFHFCYVKHEKLKKIQ